LESWKLSPLNAVLGLKSAEQFEEQNA